MGRVSYDEAWWFGVLTIREIHMRGALITIDTRWVGFGKKYYITRKMGIVGIEGVAATAAADAAGAAPADGPASFHAADTTAAVDGRSGRTNGKGEWGFKRWSYERRFDHD